MFPEYICRFTIHDLICFEWPHTGSPVDQRIAAIEFYNRIILSFQINDRVFHDLNAITPFKVSVICINRIMSLEILANYIKSDELIENWSKEYQILKLSGCAPAEDPIKIFSTLSNDNVLILPACRELMDQLEIK